MDIKAMTKADFYILDAQREVEGARKRIIDQCQDLAEYVSREAGLMAYDPTHQPNSIGIIQGRAMDIDRACAVLYATQKKLEVMEMMMKSMKEDRA